VDCRGLSAVLFPARATDISFLESIKAGSGGPLILLPIGAGSSLPGVKRAERMADDSSATSVEFMNTWSSAFTPFPLMSLFEGRSGIS